MRIGRVASTLAIAGSICFGFVSGAEARNPIKCVFGKDGHFQTKREYRTYQLHLKSEEFNLFDRNCNGIIEASERRDYLAYLEDRIDSSVEKFERDKKQGVLPEVPKLKRDAPDKPNGGWVVADSPILRDSFEDISIYSKPKERKFADGATFAYERDNASPNTIWSAKGVLAYPVAWQNPIAPAVYAPFHPHFKGFALTPLASFQKVSNSTSTIAAKKDIDLLTYGVGGEIEIGQLFTPYGDNYFRARTARVTNFSNEVRSWNVVGEYQLVDGIPGGPALGIARPLGTLPATYQFDAIFRAHYAEKIGSEIDDPLFDQSDKVFRIGPVLTLGITPDADDAVPGWLQNLSFSASYSWLQDVRTHRAYQHFNTSLTYALNQEKNIGIKISYEKGKIEETAQDVETTKVGLAVKY